MIRHTVKVMGKSVAYWERNPQWPQTIVMLHGFRGNHKGLMDIAQHFEGFRLILPDLPGYGESEPMDTEHTLVNYALWYDEFVIALGLKDYISWSHSYSGSIGLIHAATGKNRPSAMISVSLAAVRRDLMGALSVWYYQFGRIMPGPLRRRLISSRLVDHATGRWLFMTVTTERRRALMRRGDENLPTLNAKVVIEEFFSALDTNLDEYAARVPIPVLLVAGGRDVIVPVRRLEHIAAILPNGAMVVMKDQGHLAPIERPAATATITKRFIAGLRKPAGRR